MNISLFQAVLLGIFASLASLPGMGGTVLGNYTFGRPLVGGLISGLILGDVKTGIIAGAAIQIVYIALITPGGAMAADVRAISFIGIPLSIVAINNMGLEGANATSMATALGSGVGTLGTVLMYGTATMNLLWQSIGWKVLEEGKLRKLYLVDMVYPWLSHLVFSFIPTVIITYYGSSMVGLIQDYLSLDGLIMKSLFTLGSLLPCVGIAILLKQVVNKNSDLLIFMVGFTMSAALGMNLVSSAIIASFIALLTYEVRLLKIKGIESIPADSQNNSDLDFEEEDI